MRLRYIYWWHDMDVWGMNMMIRKWTNEKWQKLGPFGRWCKKHQDPTKHRSLHQHFGHVQRLFVGSFDQFEWSFSSMTIYHYSKHLETWWSLKGKPTWDLSPSFTQQSIPTPIICFAMQIAFNISLRAQILEYIKIIILFI